MFRALLIFVGSLSLSIGILGIFVPGLPTTIFLLGAAGCYVRSSDKLYNWMTRHRVLGAYINNYRKHKAMPLKSKIIALVMMWVMIGISVGYFIDNWTIRIIVIISGLIGTTVILMVKTLRKEDLNR